MKHRWHLILLAVLVLTAVLFVLPISASAETADTATSASTPFYFEPIGMMLILIVVILLIVGIVALCRKGKKDVTPTVIPLEKKNPEFADGRGKTFKEDVDRFAEEERKKEAEKDKKELNQAINEVLYDEAYDEWEKKLRKLVKERLAESEPENTESELSEPAPAPEDAVEIEQIEQDDTPDVSGEIADRVENKLDKSVDGNDVQENVADEARKTAYDTAYEEAKNISADTTDAVELVDEDENEGDPVPAGVVEPIPVDVLSEIGEDGEDTDEDDSESDTEDDAEGIESEGFESEGIESEGFNSDDNLIPQKIVYIDAKAKPDVYAEMLEREARGEVTLVYRYRKGMLSKMASAQENVKDYYNAVKNKFLSYKGVKCRSGWTSETFNKGRIKLARMDVRPKALNLYLAVAPESLEGTKYTFKDMSAKKKYAETPVLLRIRGERKLKHALELIESICVDELQLKHLENTETDYRLPSMSQDEMIEAGYVKMLVGEIPAQGETNGDAVDADTETAENGVSVENAESAETETETETAENETPTDVAENEQ